MCWCVRVFVCWCVGVLVCWCVRVLMCSCVDVFVCWCVGVLVCWCGAVLLLCCCIGILKYFLCKMVFFGFHRIYNFWNFLDFSCCVGWAFWPPHEHNQAPPCSLCRSLVFIHNMLSWNRSYQHLTTSTTYCGAENQDWIWFTTDITQRRKCLLARLQKLIFFFPR